MKHTENAIESAVYELSSAVRKLSEMTRAVME